MSSGPKKGKFILYEWNAIVFNVSELDKINWNDCLESPDTIRKSLDGTLTFVQWDTVKQPDFVGLLTTSMGPYDFPFMEGLLSTAPWFEGGFSDHWEEDIDDGEDYGWGVSDIN